MDCGALIVSSIGSAGARYLCVLPRKHLGPHSLTLATPPQGETAAPCDPAADACTDCGVSIHEHSYDAGPPARVICPTAPAPTTEGKE